MTKRKGQPTLSFSVKRTLSSSKKNREAFKLLEERPDLTFSEIAKMVKLDVEKVYYLNDVLETERLLLERIEKEEAKAERVLQRIEEKAKRLEKFRIKEIERLYFDEALDTLEIATLLDENPRRVGKVIRELKRQRGIELNAEG